MLDIRKLKHIAALAEAGSFARAAQILNISQPALSQSIQAIEQRFGIRLFDRSRRGVTLTPSGRRVVADAQKLLRDSETLERNMRLLGAAQLGEIRLGLDPLCAGLFLVGLLAYFGEHHTGLRIAASVQAATELERQLLSHKTDLIVVPRQLLSSPAQVEQLHVLTVRVALLVRQGHPLLAREGVSLDDLAGYPFIAGSSPSELERMAIDHPLWRAATIRCDDYGLMGEVAIRSNAIWMASAALPRRTGSEPALAELPLDERTPMPATDIVVATLKGLSLSPAANAIRNRLVEMSAGTGGAGASQARPESGRPNIAQCPD
jgi:DNA-binding transcriptional LysR family regulator